MPSYSAKQRENALRLCDEIGVAKASEQTGISKHTLYKWRNSAEVEVPVVPATADKKPAAEAASEAKDTRSIPPKSGVDGNTSEELAQLRIENTTLKAQLAALKNALRAFTE